MMQWKSDLHRALLVGAVVLATTLVASAEDKKDDADRPALSGAWALTGGETKIAFSEKDVMKISPHGKDDVILIVCKYTVDKSGLVKAKVTELEGKEKEKAKDVVPVGLTLSFKWTIKDETATLSDLDGKDVEPLKSHLEGKYEKK